VSNLEPHDSGYRFLVGKVQPSPDLCANDALARNAVCPVNLFSQKDYKYRYIPGHGKCTL